MEDPFDSIVLQGEEIENISDYCDILREDNNISQEITQGDCLNSDFFKYFLRRKYNNPWGQWFL